MIAAAPTTSLAVITDRGEFLEPVSKTFGSRKTAGNLMHLSHKDLLAFPATGFPEFAVCDLVTSQDEAIPSVFHLAAIHDVSKTIFLLDPSDQVRIDNWLHILYRLGARACVSSHKSTDCLPEVLDDLQEGQMIVSREFGGDFPRNSDAVKPSELRGPLARITLRQIEILVLLAAGRTVQQVAAVLHLSPRTVESHKYHMMKTLGCECVIGLCRFAIRHGLLNP